MSRRLTTAEIEAGRSPRGGWTRETLAGWGVPWPPPKGWRKRLLADGTPGRGSSTASPKSVVFGRTGRPVVDDAGDRPPWEAET